MDLTLDIDHCEKRVSVEKSGDRYRFEIDGRVHTVESVNATHGTLALLIDRRSWVVHFSRGDGGLRLSIGGRNFRLIEGEMDADHPGVRAGSGAGGGNIESPMPGSVVAVNVSEGDIVALGQPLVVVESMKMQNEIVAPAGGVVARVHCSPGRQVGLGDVLVEIQPESETR